MKNLTFIIPVHEYVKEYIDKAIDSVSIFTESRVAIIGPTNVLEELKDKSSDVLTKLTDVDFIVNDTTETGFCEQVNKAAMSCTTEYFSILEFDDVITPTWVKNVKEYTENKKDVSVFLPILEIVNSENTDIVSLGNEIAWSTAFVDDLGYLDMDAINAYYDFQICGGVFKTEDFISIGGLKQSLKIASVFEMLMRYLQNSKKVFVIPKIGCIHTYGRNGSYMVTSKDEITQEEGEWLINTAKQEIFFKEDRNKKFKE